ncbi:hypothetical protein A2382_01665 [Candidatus Woesebacteria bacterium RIFOXYB1_FULL_38_16]|uniref:Uncharacterized protein n=1 Tax=Candidatus Woesebacteria bacterium RIFOXYB1_FULL_38_16 TaxID=1802538 RepID=A0A1F8CV45_9BACT|nr:MAG: hypothetical protein A2191_03245 [Candidatus Woesebacteria bacterium RIFOXYA1_FULL_38_9]OGM80131.1 MAG: hypothetical protein A2382_01665 [Candidatus Woesebacteria bacterium RIFOXYB1_FULL_38_16]
MKPWKRKVRWLVGFIGGMPIAALLAFGMDFVFVGVLVLQLYTTHIKEESKNFFSGSDKIASVEEDGFYTALMVWMIAWPVLAILYIGFKVITM